MNEETHRDPSNLEEGRSVDEPKREKVTERDMLDLLHKRYDKDSQGNGSRYVVADHVRLSTGFAPYGTRMRTADFMALDLWPSSGLKLHGHEIKVSRSDWLRELSDQSKAEAVARYCDRWWIVVSDEAIVKPGELPDGWGLIVKHGDGLRVARQAPKRAAEPMPRGLIAALMRSAAVTAAMRGEAARRLRKELATYQWRVEYLERERTRLAQAQ